MVIQGEVIDIIYQNEINSYVIATFETQEELTTIVGYLPFVNPADNLKLTGRFIEHKEYGRQFKVDTFEKLMPQTLNALEKYLSNGNIKGIGKALAKRIIREFGEETIQVFQSEPSRLVQVRGITEVRAKEMAESFNENWEIWQIVGFLDKFGIGANYAKKVYTLFGVHAMEEIEANPYLLIDIARGVDFKQIDKMALDLGMEYNNAKRIKTGIKYALQLATYNGHSCVLKHNLLEFVIAMLKVEAQMVEDNLIELRTKDEIIIEKREEEWVYLKAYYQTEEDIASKLHILMKSSNVKRIDKIEQKLKKIQKNAEIQLSEKQIEAIQMVNENNVIIITGGPGTGKTTIIKSIIEIYEEKSKKVVLCAPTGRAAKKMSETTNKEACTLHRLLEIGKIDEDNLYKNIGEYEGTPIDADVVIVDELSMVDMFLMDYLLKCIYRGTKLVLVGDMDQLSSVGPGSVLKDCIESEVIPTIHLDKIFRQAAKSRIIVNAHRVNQGLGFIKKEEQDQEEDAKEDFFYINEYSQENMLKQVLSLCTGRLKNYGDYDFFKNIQVLTPTKRGVLGTKELNKALQESVNPNLGDKVEKIIGSVIFREGDRVMQIKNNYDMDWEKPNEEKAKLGRGVFNGEIGTIQQIDETQKTVDIEFDDGKIASYEFTELDQIEHSYSITIHKAQRQRI